MQIFVVAFERHFSNGSRLADSRVLSILNAKRKQRATNANAMWTLYL